MNWTAIIDDVLNNSGLQEWLSDVIESNKDDIDNIEEYVTNMVVDMISGKDKDAYKQFKNLKKPTDKLKAARFLIGRARQEKRNYDEFKKSVATVLGAIVGSAAKSLL